MFDPTFKSHPAQDFPDLAYDIAARVVNRFDFIEWEDVEKEDYWIWKLIVTEIEKLAKEDDDKEEWTESPL